MYNLVHDRTRKLFIPSQLNKEKTTMAFRPEEIKRLEALSDEVIKLLQDKETSNEANVAFGRIGNACTKALAAHASMEAKKTTRTGNITKFQAARQARAQARKGSSGTPSTSSTASASSSHARSS